MEALLPTTVRNRCNRLPRTLTGTPACPAAATRGPHNDQQKNKKKDATHLTSHTIMRLAEGMGDGATNDVAVEAWEASEVSGSAAAAAAAAAARRVRARWRRRA